MWLCRCHLGSKCHKSKRFACNLPIQWYATDIRHWVKDEDKLRADVDSDIQSNLGDVEVFSEVTKHVCRK